MEKKKRRRGGLKDDGDRYAETVDGAIGMAQSSAIAQSRGSNKGIYNLF